MTREERIESCALDAISAWGGEHPGIRLYWSGAPGFGTYDLLFGTDENKLEVKGMSECMDSNEDKGYLKHLLLALANAVNIIE